MTDSNDRGGPPGDRLDTLEQRNENLEQEVARLARENERLRERVESLEAAAPAERESGDARSSLVGTDPPKAGERPSGESATAPAASVSTDYKVRGRKAAAGGTGILGHNTVTSGVSTGVEGVTDAEAQGAAGVRGIATATTGGTYGVWGTGDSPGTQGVVGSANADPLPQFFFASPTGVWGYTDRSSADSGVDAGYGVFGQATATSGTAHGVAGVTNASDGFAVYADGDSKTNGTHEAERLTQNKVGARVQTFTDQTISSYSTGKISFDEVDFDPGSEFDTGTNEFSPTKAGVYNIVVLLETKTPGTALDFVLMDRGNPLEIAEPDQSREISLSTWRQLSSNASLWIRASNGTGDSIVVRSVKASFIRVG